MAVYIASPASLRLVPWQEESPAFHVKEARPDDPVRTHFPWPNVCCAGSHQGCGCGFAYNRLHVASQDAEEEARCRASTAALRQYVTEAVTAGPVHLFACWEGAQASQEQDRVLAMPTALGGESFEFVELRMLVFPLAG
jgi:hypothetical protein